MLSADEYLKLDLGQRQSHFDLLSPCLERGGISTNHKGVLAQFLDTPIYGRPANLCHACHNGACSNPRHLYWGSHAENVADSISNGTHTSVWDNTVNKYGHEEACKMRAEFRKKGAIAGGAAGKGKPKSKEHREKISESLKS